MSRYWNNRQGFAWLETLLVLALLALVLQLFPSLLGLLDVRNWSRGTWFAMNGVVVLILLAIRFGPDLVEDWRQRRQQSADLRTRAAKAAAAKAKQEKTRLLEQGRRRRIY